jgi:competence protein ComEC
VHYFWLKNPALFYGISFLFGVYSSQCIGVGLFFVLCLFWFPFFINKRIQRLLLSIVLYTAAFFYTSLVVAYPPIPAEGINGTARLKIDSVTRKDTSMGKRWNYSGELIQFQPEDRSVIAFHHVPITINLPDNDEITRPSADRAYEIQGKLKQAKSGRHTFTPISGKPWLPIEGTWSLAEWRYSLKRDVNDYILQKIFSDPTRSFLSGITTGDFENRLISYELSRFGLQHIMAISGFHFSIIAGILGFILSLVFNRKVACVMLMILMTLYFIFLGGSPSIARAWICSIIAFAAFIFEKPATALNSLGVAIILVLLMNPDFAWGIGFQFSFLVTGSILLLYGPIDLFLQNILPKRKYSEVIEMNDANQHGFIALSLFRQGLALTIAVNAAAMPLTLYYFERFPVMSLLYNFFFPWMVSISMLLLMGGLFFDLFVPPLGRVIHLCNEYFTQFILDYTYHMPKSIDVHLYSTVSKDMAIAWLGLLFTMAIWIRYYAQKRKGVLLQELNI